MIASIKLPGGSKMRLALLVGCAGLLAASGCTRHGLLLDFSIELNRIPWRTGCERCGSGCGAIGCDSSNCGASCRRSAGAVASTLPEPAPSRFHPVPTRPVFAPAVAQVAVAEEMPRPQTRKVRRPRQRVLAPAAAEPIALPPGE